MRGPVATDELANAALLLSRWIELKALPFHETLQHARPINLQGQVATAVALNSSCLLSCFTGVRCGLEALKLLAEVVCRVP